ncbi:MAG: acetylglutamate kinase [Candidatus Peregrinibacteria bacterium]|nr:acetylglutamate kinase [Candidatus Peregrinibacteria bacterium]MDZ4245367.1 acetylglutamate kinase [Candidatus Gracilibacteria bacterium]
MSPVKKTFYLKKFKGKVFVVKIGGEVIQSKKILENILKDVKELVDSGVKIVFVHGGGTQADQISEKLGFKPQKIDGRRVTTAEDLEVVKMLYGGTLNLEILSILKKLGAKGIRVSGLDGNLLQVHLRDKKNFDYGYVGDISAVNSDILYSLLSEQYLPIVSPIAATDDGTIVNINADTIAAQIAIALKAEKLILFTKASGVMNGDRLFSALTIKEAEGLIEDHVVTEGMIVKVENSIQAAQNGVKRVHILNGLSPHSLLKEVMTTEGVGTMILSDSEKQIYLDE